MLRNVIKIMFYGCDKNGERWLMTFSCSGLTKRAAQLKMRHKLVLRYTKGTFDKQELRLFLVGYLGVRIKIPRWSWCIACCRWMSPRPVSSSGIERVYNYLLSTFDLCSTEWTPLSFRILKKTIEIKFLDKF